jgi:hypothetical protein
MIAFCAAFRLFSHYEIRRKAEESFFLSLAIPFALPSPVALLFVVKNVLID